MKKLSTHISESFINEAKSLVTTKDYDRMMKLVLKGDDGEKMANSLKNKDKAIARYVAGCLLSGAKEVNYDDRFKSFSHPFSDFGDKAIELGATIEEIKTVFDSTEAPQSYFDKMTKLGKKKLDNRFVGDISRAILALGADIEYQKHNGYAITYDGKEAMQRNGRKWTIGYKTKIEIDSKQYDLVFDAITCEGDGPTLYVIDDSSDSHSIFTHKHKGVMGKRAFLKLLQEIITSVQAS